MTGRKASESTRGYFLILGVPIGVDIELFASMMFNWLRSEVEIGNDLHAML